MTLVSLVPRLSCGHKSLGMRLDLIVPTDKLLWHIFLLKKEEKHRYWSNTCLNWSSMTTASWVPFRSTFSWIMLDTSHSRSSSILKWGPQSETWSSYSTRKNGAPGSLFSWDYGDPFMKFGTPAWLTGSPGVLEFSVQLTILKPRNVEIPWWNGNLLCGWSFSRSIGTLCMADLQ